MHVDTVSELLPLEYQSQKAQVNLNKGHNFVSGGDRFGWWASPSDAWLLIPVLAFFIQYFGRLPRLCNIMSQTTQTWRFYITVKSILYSLFVT